MKRYKISEITKSGVKFEGTSIDYEEELRVLIPDLKAAKTHTVIFLDEFAEVISKLTKQGKNSDAIDILHTLREIRSDKDFEHFTLVFAGSIGLEFVIKTIDRPKLINDLHPIHTSALTSDECSKLILQLTKGATINLSVEVTEHIKLRTHHLLPYYIQLMLEEIDLIAREANQPIVSAVMVDNAFNRVLSKNKNFEDWIERLKDYQATYFPFINELLKHAAHNDGISIQEIYNKAMDKRFNRSDDYMDFVEQLCNDGYLMQTENNVYRFVSPFLKEFWLRKNPVYNG